VFHLILHFILPALVARLAFCEKAAQAYLIMIATMLVDLDHLLANPIYDPNRCSIGFHPLHGLIPIVIYVLLLIPAKSRLIGLGLIIHMLLDSVDCQLTNGIWYS